MTRSIGLTGGAGFIGTNLIRMIESGYPDWTIRVFDNMSNPSGDGLGRAELTTGDIEDAESLAAWVEGLDCVVHLAAHTRVVDSIDQPVPSLMTNIVGSLTVFEAMRAKGVRKLVCASTGGALLGDVAPPIHEAMVPSPLSPYGAGKMAVEGLMSAYAGSYGFDAVALRFSNVYGPHCAKKESVVAAFLKSISRTGAVTVYGDGHQTRDFVYVTDICRSILAALDLNGFHAIQVASGVPTSVLTLINQIRAVTGLQFDVRHEPARVGEVIETYCEIAKARSLLGLQSPVPLKRGLERIWSWCQSEGLWNDAG